MSNLPKDGFGADTSADAGGDGPEEVTETKRLRRRKDGARNKMSFDVDELEEELYQIVEDEADLEEYTAYEEVPDEEAIAALAAAAAAADSGTDAAGRKVKEKGEDAAGYKIRPDLSQKFRPGTVQGIIAGVMKEILDGKEYHSEDSEQWTQQILEQIHDKVKEEKYRRYKIITNVTLGERRGEGASSATRCLWDAEADCIATYTFLNETIFCNGTVYGIYFY